jgi:hypothetical protein
MKDEDLDKIIEEAGEEFPRLLGELRDHILHAAAAVLEESQDSEKGSAKLKIGLALTLDLALSPPGWEAIASVGVRHKARSGEMRGVSREGVDSTEGGAA